MCVGAPPASFYLCKKESSVVLSILAISILHLVDVYCE